MCLANVTIVPVPQLHCCTWTSTSCVVAMLNDLLGRITLIVPQVEDNSVKTVGYLLEVFITGP